jgi:hypothetical protein
MNLLGVMAVLCQSGHSLSDVVSACHHLQAVPGRMQSWGHEGTPAVVVDYAHTPDAVAKALQALRPWAHARGGRLHCVLGSGGDRDSSKRAPMARSAEDCALILSAMSGFDARDSTSALRPPQNYAARLNDPRADASPGQPLGGLRIGLPREFFPADLATDVHSAVRTALCELEKLGACLVDVSLPRTELSIPVYYIIAPAEASSNLSRFDGVRFGHRGHCRKPGCEKRVVCPA